MHKLTRRVPLFFGLAEGDSAPTGGPYTELEVSCRGRPDPDSGYVMNISEIDAAVRRGAGAMLGRAMRAWATGSARPAALVLGEVAGAVGDRLGETFASIRWRVSPYHSFLLEAGVMDRVVMSRTFEFSAAHRLHSRRLSEERNRELFGKCNNPSGHGHNYKLCTDVSVPCGDGDGPFGFATLDRLVKEHVLLRFDHKNLNIDTVEFADLNPSVEHIAMVCHDLLAGPVAEAGGRLESVTVWETEKTSCTYGRAISDEPRSKRRT